MARKVKINNVLDGSVREVALPSKPAKAVKKDAPKPVSKPKGDEHGKSNG